MMRRSQTLRAFRPPPETVPVPVMPARRTCLLLVAATSHRRSRCPDRSPNCAIALVGAPVLAIQQPNRSSARSLVGNSNLTLYAHTFEEECWK